MKRTQVVLAPTRSKKLIAKAVVEMDPVKKALEDGIVVIHPSSSTYFMMEYITGNKPEGIWLIGMICSKGTCVEGLYLKAYEEESYSYPMKPSDFPFSWVFRKGKFEKGLKLAEVLSEMNENDVYIKGVNAIDSYGQVGVLFAKPGGGTIGKILGKQKEKRFHLIFVGGLEKFLPTSIEEIAKESGKLGISEAWGLTCTLLPIKASPVTEIEALKMLAEVDAIPVAAGGVGGAEGSLVMVIKGEDRQVKKAMEILETLRDAKLPEVIIPSCETCHITRCNYFGKKIDG